MKNEIFSYDPTTRANLQSVPMDSVKLMKIFKSKSLDRFPFINAAKMAETAESTIVYVMKQIVTAIEHTMETGYTSKLNLRIGHLRFINDGKFQFINNGSEKQRDSVSQATSCNTEYRVNKRYLTSLRERANEFDQETVFSTVKDALTNLSSATPRSRQRTQFFSPTNGGGSRNGT